MLTTMINRTRRNHALEHATIHVLSEKQKNFSAQGNSTHKGFFLNIYGDIPEATVSEAVHEAFGRMKNGESELAVHPNCGTVLLTTATLSALAAQAAFGVEQKRQKRATMDLSTLFNALPTAVLAVVLMLIVSRPIGMRLQANYTTDGNMGDMEIVDIRRIAPSPVTHFFQFLLGHKLKPTAYLIETAN